MTVNAALAYNESAKLLKETGWKVNFKTLEEFEAAKVRELKSFFGKGNGTGSISEVDVAGSLATVAMKVEEIALYVQEGMTQGDNSTVKSCDRKLQKESVGARGGKEGGGGGETGGTEG